MSYMNTLTTHLNAGKVNATTTFTQKFQYHLVTVSPWPMLMSISLLFTLGTIAQWFHGHTTSWFFDGLPLFVPAFTISLIVLYYWMKDITVEATYLGDHTDAVQHGLVIGFILFVVNEVMFFVGFFWAYLHSALVPTQDIGGVWPPFSLETLNPYEVPLVNTVLLLVSAMALTASHHNTNSFTNVETPLLSAGISPDNISANYSAWSKWWASLNQLKTVICLTITIVLAIVFTAYQYLEYSTSAISIADSVYGSVFFMTTGFHGIHVFMGTVMLSVTLVRFFFKHNIAHHIVGYENAILYYHFVDIVWLLVFLLFYWWAWIGE